MAESSKTFLGKYELLEVIGDGAEGRVYKAVCAAADVPGVARGELVAVKRLKSTGHEKESLQFRRQIEILGKLNHPNIVRHIGSFIWREKELDEDIYCLVMELLEGETLKELLKKKPHVFHGHKRAAYCGRLYRHFTMPAIAMSFIATLSHPTFTLPRMASLNSSISALRVRTMAN